MSSVFKNIIVLLGIVLTGAIGYYLYMQNNSSDASSNNASVDNSIAVDTASFLNSLNELKAIQLDGSILSDPRFTSLTSYAAPVHTQPIGRPDPFTIN